MSPTHHGNNTGEIQSNKIPTEQIYSNDIQEDFSSYYGNQNISLKRNSAFSTSEIIKGRKKIPPSRTRSKSNIEMSATQDMKDKLWNEGTIILESPLGSDGSTFSSKNDKELQNGILITTIE